MFTPVLLFSKGKKKKYTNALGVFTYRDVHKHIYPYGIELHKENNYYYAMATPEKALCDKLYICLIVKNKKEMLLIIFDDLRIDFDTLKQLNFNELSELCDTYKSTNMKYLKKVLRDINSNKITDID